MSFIWMLPCSILNALAGMAHFVCLRVNSLALIIMAMNALRVRMRVCVLARERLIAVAGQHQDIPPTVAYLCRLCWPTIIPVAVISAIPGQLLSFQLSCAHFACAKTLVQWFFGGTSSIFGIQCS